MSIITPGSARIASTHGGATLHVTAIGSAIPEPLTARRANVVVYVGGRASRDNSISAHGSGVIPVRFPPDVISVFDVA
jgi:hypothetical protein